MQKLQGRINNQILGVKGLTTTHTTHEGAMWQMSCVRLPSAKAKASCVGIGWENFELRCFILLWLALRVCCFATEKHTKKLLPFQHTKKIKVKQNIMLTLPKQLTFWVRRLRYKHKTSMVIDTVSSGNLNYACLSRMECYRHHLDHFVCR